MQFLTLFKRMNTFQIISLVGFAAVFVIVIILIGKNGGAISEFAAENNSAVTEQEIAGVQKSQLGTTEIVGSIPLEGVQTFDGEAFVYTDISSGFLVEDNQPFEETSEAEFRLPFYWQELYQGEAFATDVETFVVNKSFQEFVSGIRYGLHETFINGNEVEGVQRTTGFENSFVHQAYVDLENGTTLVFELRTHTEEYPIEISKYLETIDII